MKIEKIVEQHRRDFYAIYKCESCGDSFKDSGYDDRNFHDNVVPAMVCKKCGLSSVELGSKIEHTETLYSEGFQV